MVPWKHTPGTLGPIASSHAVMIWKVTCTRAPIPDTLCIEGDCFHAKLIEARLLTSRGQARQAGAVLDRWIWSGGGPLFVIGVMERGRIAEGLGDRQKAIDSYQFVADVWRRADPQLQPLVVEARNALTRMTRE